MTQGKSLARSLPDDKEFPGFPDHVLRIFCREFLGGGKATETGGSRELVAVALVHRMGIAD